MFVQIILNEIAMILRGSALAAYLAHAVLFKLVKDYKTCLIRVRHSLVAFLPVHIEKNELMRDAGIRDLKNPYMGTIRHS